MSQNFELKKVTEFCSHLLQCYNNFASIFRGKGREEIKYLGNAPSLFPFKEDKKLVTSVRRAKKSPGVITPRPPHR